MSGLNLLGLYGCVLVFDALAIAAYAALLAVAVKVQRMACDRQLPRAWVVRR